MSKNPHYRAGLMALSFALLPLAMLVSRPAGADELMKWERIPLQIPLKVGQERVVFVDKTSASVFRRRLTVNSGCRAPGEPST